MARIPVEKKGGGPAWWWWILGLILVAGLIWLVAEALDDDAVVEDVPVATDTTLAPPVGAPADTVTGDAPARVREFIAFQQADTAGVDVEMGRHHEYTSRGIELLAGALSAVVDQRDTGDINIEARRDTMMQRAEAIQEDPTSPQHANKVRDAFLSATDLMESIQEKHHPDAAPAVAEVRQAAESISPEEPLLDQSEDVKAFFDRAGDALQRITGTAGVS